MISRLLEIPGIFQLQQKISNNYSNVKAEFVDYLETSSLNILDVGCSTGICGQAIFDMAQNQYIGIDITSKYIEYARKAYKQGKYLVMDGRNLDFPDNFFDIISFVGVVHHMNDETIKSCLEEVKRVLKPTGHLLIAEPVLTPNRLISNIFLSVDRGKYIRETSQYLDLLSDFDIIRKQYFSLSLHRFLSVVATRK